MKKKISNKNNNNNNNNNIEEFSKIIGINNIKPNNRIITKNGNKKGTVTSNMNENFSVNVKFNNQANSVKMPIYKLRKNTVTTSANTFF